MQTIFANKLKINVAKIKNSPDSKKNTYFYYLGMFPKQGLSE
ncbi:MAG: hypothetical protein ACJAS3_000175 [Roseivirga sp.]|jgi:hypothetical protein